MQTRENYISRSKRAIISNNDMVEITLNINDESVAVHSIKTMQSMENHISRSKRAISNEAMAEIELDNINEGSNLKTTIVEDPEASPLESTTLLRREKSSISSRIFHVSQELRRLVPFMKTTHKSSETHVPGGLNFVSKTDVDGGWKDVESRFDRLTMDTHGLLRRADFGKCIGMIKMPEDEKSFYKRIMKERKNEDKKSKKSKDEQPKKKERKDESEDFAVQVFDAVSRYRHISSGFINKAEMLEFWEIVSDQKFDHRLMLFINMIDKNDDGIVSKDEVREIIALSATASKLPNIRDKADEYAEFLMEELDPDNLGYIMDHALKNLLLEAPTHPVRRSESIDLSRMLSQSLKSTSNSSPLRKWYGKVKYFLLDNWQRVWMMALWLGVMAGLFTYKYIQYKNKAEFEVMGHCICMAKGAAETLKLNIALILLPVCRNTITWLRNKTRLGVAIPFDDNINFHHIVATAIAIGVGIHGISHLTCDFPRLLHATPEEYEPMRKYFGDQPSSYWWFIKGVEGVTGIIMVVLMTIAFTLASPWLRNNKVKLPKPLIKVTGFNAFWYSHHLFVMVYTLLIVHSIKLYLTKEWYRKTTWMYLAVPVLLYLCERLVRAFRPNIEPVEVLKVAAHPGDRNVLSLQMSKPKGFQYRSGQYMFVKCPDVSPFEWHPFSITSAPGDDYLSVHIRTLGDWTRELKKKYEKLCPPSQEGTSGIRLAEFSQGQNNPKVPRLLIDGPYGAPAQDYKNYDVVLLLGLGIGATPMISIVKDIMNNMRAMKGDTTSPSPSNGAGPGSRKKSGDSFRTRRAYFYWVTPEQGFFNWFKEVLNEVSGMDHQGVIEMHNYCTSVKEEGDARSALITKIQSLYYDKNGYDIVSGTKVKSHSAKPNWRNVYKSIVMKHPNSRIGVFYCGAPELGKTLKHLASDFSQKCSTKFDFHKENF